LGNNLRIIFGTDVSGASISPFYDPSDYPGTWAIHFTSIALRKGAEAYHVLSPDTGDCYDPFTFGAEDQPDNCCFETIDGHYYADGTPFGLDGIAELIYIDSEGIPREGSKGRIDVLTFQTERYDYCEECSGGCADEPKGSLSVSLRFEGVEAQDPGCTFGVEGDIARLPDGVFNFYGTTGTPNSSFCGPGSSDLRCDPAYAARVASGTNVNTNNGGSGGGTSSDNTGAAASGGDGANECDAFSDTTSYFGDIQFDSICWQAGVYRTCKADSEADQTCGSLGSFLEAVGASESVSVCPYCQ